MISLLRSGVKKSDLLPMPFFGTGGKLVLSLYWWLWKIFGPAHHWDDYNTVIRILNTPIKVQAWLYANIRYRTDKKPEDQWQTAKRTFQRRRGDCEDWAVFANECLKKKYDGLFLCMYTKDSGHATYLINRGKNRWTSVGTYGYIDHSGPIRSIIPDWSGFAKWTSATVKNENLGVIEEITR